jgi:ribosomal protein L21E
MGEYFQGVKIGTCEHLMYITRKEAEHYKMANYLNLKHRYIYRFDEHGKIGTLTKINHREPYDFRKIKIVPTDKIEIPHRRFQSKVQTVYQEYPSTVNFPYCIHSKEAIEAGFHVLHSYGIELYVIGERYDQDHPNGYTIFSCTTCEEWFPMTEQEIQAIEQLQSDVLDISLLKPKIVI